MKPGCSQWRLRAASPSYASRWRCFLACGNRAEPMPAELREEGGWGHLAESEAHHCPERQGVQAWEGDLVGSWKFPVLFILLNTDCSWSVALHVSWPLQDCLLVCTGGAGPNGLRLCKGGTSSKLPDPPGWATCLFWALLIQLCVSSPNKPLPPGPGSDKMQYVGTL